MHAGHKYFYPVIYYFNHSFFLCIVYLSLLFSFLEYYFCNLAYLFITMGNEILTININNEKRQKKLIKKLDGGLKLERL